MSKDPFAKLRSSLTLDDLLDQTGNYHPKNWLLTYLDVFVLTVMLVITMLALSDFKTQQNPILANPSPPIRLEKAPMATLTKPEQKTIAPDNKVALDHSNKNDKVIPSATPEMTADENIPHIASAPSQINTQQTRPEFEPIPPAQQIAPESGPIQSLQTLEEEKRLQQQLTKTINEFGLKDAVHIKVKQGYAQLEIQDKVLFKSSQADLTADGSAVLKRLTPLLKQAEGLLLIEGHTDNLPINTAQFPSNWELGSSRATSVLHFLTSQQLDSSRMRATTYADTQPIADNTTNEGREQNRRVSILIKVSDQQP